MSSSSARTTSFRSSGIRTRPCSATRRGTCRPSSTRAPRKRACGSATCSARTATARAATSRSRAAPFPCRISPSAGSSSRRPRSRAAHGVPRHVRRRRPDSVVVARHRVRLPDRRGKRRRNVAQRRRHHCRHVDHAGQCLAAGPAVVDRDPAAHEAARLTARPDVPRGPLQREQRAGGGFLHQHADHGARRLEHGQPGELDCLQRRLPLGLQHRRPRRCAERNDSARLGGGVRPEARDPDRGHRLPVRRHRLS